jgi:hypothetical protein
MRGLSTFFLFLVACTGGQHFAGFDAGDDAAGDGSMPDAYEPDLGALSFATAATYMTNEQPISFAAGNLTGDAYPDLAVTSYQDLNVIVLANDGDGTFTNIATISVGTGNQPSAVAIGDFNGDGLGDLAVTIYASARPNLLVFLNSGDGTAFTGPTSYATGSGPFGVIAARLNADTNDDVLVTSSDSSELSVLIGNGNGTLQSADTTGVAVVPRDLAVADLNDDGDADVVLAHYGSGQASVLLGDGAGGFTSNETFAVGDQAMGVATADFDGDGHIDVVATAEGTNSAYYLRGNGDGTLDAAVPHSVGMQPNSVAVADFNDDGRADFITANAASNSVSIYLGRGDGTFVGPKNITTSAGALRPIAVDFDNDGRVDFATNGMNADRVSVHINTTP